MVCRPSDKRARVSCHWAFGAQGSIGGWAKGTALARLGLAINRSYTLESGEKKEEVTFVDVDAFGRQAEVVTDKDFVTMTGGGYFFVPSLTTLRRHAAQSISNSAIKRAALCWRARRWAC